MEFSETATYYDEKYFAFQKDMGEFGGWAETMKFSSHVAPNATVVDFGCGGGFLLKNLNCAKKIGIEINDTARHFAENTNDITAVKYAEELDDAVADLIISNHALEHCISPHKEISCLLKKLKPNGRLVVFVPCESIHNGWFPGDVNNHLYTWNPMTLGNLFASAGYEVESVEAYYHVWPPYYRKIAKFGARFFHLCCHAYGVMRKSDSQIKIVAKRKVP